MTQREVCCMFFPIPAFRSFRQWMDTSSAFVRAWVRSPRSVGMVCPSGMPLARSMAAFAPRKGDGLVVELGAGTGTVTRQLLDAGIAPRRLVVVEQSPVMVSLLRERFPQLAILEAASISRKTTETNFLKTGKNILNINPNPLQRKKRKNTPTNFPSIH